MTSCLPIGTFKATFTNMPGFSFRLRVWRTRRGHVAVRVFISTCGKDSPPVRGMFVPDRHPTVTDAGSPTSSRAEIGLKDLRVDPHRGEIGYGVQPCFGLHIQVGQSVALRDVSGRANRPRFPAELVPVIPG